MTYEAGTVDTDDADGSGFNPWTFVTDCSGSSAKRCPAGASWPNNDPAKTPPFLGLPLIPKADGWSGDVSHTGSCVSNDTGATIDLAGYTNKLEVDLRPVLSDGTKAFILVGKSHFTGTPTAAAKAKSPADCYDTFIDSVDIFVADNLVN